MSICLIIFSPLSHAPVILSSALCHVLSSTCRIILSSLSRVHLSYYLLSSVSCPPVLLSSPLCLMSICLIIFSPLSHIHLSYYLLPSVSCPSVLLSSPLCPSKEALNFIEKCNSHLWPQWSRATAFLRPSSSRKPTHYESKESEIFPLGPSQVSHALLWGYKRGTYTSTAKVHGNGDSIETPKIGHV